MPFSLCVRFRLKEKNCICGTGYKFHPPHLTNVTLLHYLGKVETLKMHVNTNSAFNVNYEIAVKCTKLYWQFHKMFWWTMHIIQYKRTIISQHVFKESATNTRTMIPEVRRSRHWSICISSITFCLELQSQPKFASSVFAGHGCHKSSFRTRIAA